MFRRTPDDPSGSIPGPVRDFLDLVLLAPRQSWKSLTLWPLVLQEEAAPSGVACLPLSRALALGSARVEEVGEHGSVPHVRVTNDGDQPVLFLFGAEIVGAKQNRVANATFLVPPRTQTVIDVSCVESGRWQRRSRHFGDADSVLASSMRRGMHERVVASRERSRDATPFVAGQGEVWGDVAQRLHGSHTASSTGAYSDYLAGRKPDLEEAMQPFHALPRQVGFVAAIGDEIVGLEALGRPEILDECFQALLRSYAIDAIDAGMLSGLGSRGRQRRFDAPEPFLEALVAAACQVGPSRGLGVDLRLHGAGVSGCALVEEGLVHVSAFAA